MQDRCAESKDKLYIKNKVLKNLKMDPIFADLVCEGDLLGLEPLEAATIINLSCSNSV